MNKELSISVCPGTLAEGFSTYSPKCRKELFNGEKVRHILTFPAFQHSSSAQQQELIENRKNISISGVQEKYSLKLTGNILELTESHGQYILKPIPSGLIQPDQVPANEHLTMQIASQIFKLPTAKNAMIFFSDGQPAYITKRFDIKDNGLKCLKEDFASMAEMTDKIAGKNYKYDYSYEKMALLIDKYFPASIKAKEEFFRLVVFNYLFSNGDAHLKNFSRIDCSGSGDGMLAPAYDLINTQLHISDSDLALTEGLYENDYNYASYNYYGCYCYDDFTEFGKRIGLLPGRIKRIIQNFLTYEERIVSLIGKSFLNAESKEKYTNLYFEKLKRLKTSFSGLI